MGPLLRLTPAPAMLLLLAAAAGGAYGQQAEPGFCSDEYTLSESCECYRVTTIETSQPEFLDLCDLYFPSAIDVDEYPIREAFLKEAYETFDLKRYWTPYTSSEDKTLCYLSVKGKLEETDCLVEYPGVCMESGKGATVPGFWGAWSSCYDGSRTRVRSCDCCLDDTDLSEEENCDEEPAWSPWSIQTDDSGSTECPDTCLRTWFRECKAGNGTGYVMDEKYCNDDDETTELVHVCSGDNCE